jgi:predicted ATPase
LLENASNIALVLNNLQQDSATGNALIKQLGALYGGILRPFVRIEGGTAKLFLEEEGSGLIPAPRLSDGTLRYLCLLAVLCHPDPPPLVCIEEPELGLHPDVLPALAELLVDASARTQLIVTTHSSALVSALSDNAESVVVCGRDTDGSHFRRVAVQEIKTLLKQYTLGELWRMGEIGGNRW